MIDQFRRYISFLALALWLGGLTFYAMIVVPTGTRVIGRVDQGFVTSAVTLKLNWIGAVAFSVLLWDLAVARSRIRWGVWGVLILIQLALVLLHPQLDRILDFTSREVIDQSRFYALHRVYLWLIAAQWLSGMYYAWLLARTTIPDSEISDH